MKRYFALFTATLILVSNCIIYTPVKAVGSSVDFAEIFSEYLSLAEMSMALTQGVEIDWSNYEFDANATNQEKAKALINYYYGLIYNGLDYFLDISGNNDVISESMAAIALQTSGNLSSENIQDLRSQVASALQNYAVTDNWDVPIMQHYDDLCIANWNKYNSMYINDYLANIDESEVIDYPDTTNNVSLGTISFSGNPISYSAIGCQRFDFYDEIQMVYDCYYPCAWVTRNNGFINAIKIIGANLTPHNQQNYAVIVSYDLDFTHFLYPVFESESEAVQFSRTGSIISGGQIAVNVPNAVIDNSSEDGKIVAHPIYYPDAVKLDGLVNIDLDAVRDTIIDAIANGRSRISIDDIVDVGAAVKVDGTTLTDADTKTIDASVPIEACKADTLVVPLNAVPGLPKLPPIIPPGGSGDTNNVPNGFSGMSVLARIINVTVQSVPQPLIMCFFGVIFGMVILGIIKILHH